VSFVYLFDNYDESSQQTALSKQIASTNDGIMMQTVTNYEPNVTSNSGSKTQEQVVANSEAAVSADETKTSTSTNQSTNNNYTNAERILVGTKSFGSHWISPYGTIIIKKVGGIISLSGNQISGDDMCSIEGEIIIIDDRNFKFNGEISLTYHYTDHYTDYETSQPKVEKKTLYGEQVFRRFGKRPYWRLKQPDSNFGYFVSCYHYIDIFMY